VSADNGLVLTKVGHHFPLYQLSRYIGENEPVKFFESNDLEDCLKVAEEEQTDTEYNVVLHGFLPKTYKITRFYRDNPDHHETISTGLSLTFILRLEE